MPEKFYPVILVAITGSIIHFKTVHNAVQYDAFCSRFVRAGTCLKEIKTLEAWYLERMSKFDGSFQ
jgi:hypothetical protein